MSRKEVALGPEPGVEPRGRCCKNCVYCFIEAVLVDINDYDLRDRYAPPHLVKDLKVTCRRWPPREDHYLEVKVAETWWCGEHTTLDEYKTSKPGMLPSFPSRGEA